MDTNLSHTHTNVHAPSDLTWQQGVCTAPVGKLACNSLTSGNCFITSLGEYNHHVSELPSHPQHLLVCSSFPAVSSQGFMCHSDKMTFYTQKVYHLTLQLFFTAAGYIHERSIHIYQVHRCSVQQHKEEKRNTVHHIHPVTYLLPFLSVE